MFGHFEIIKMKASIMDKLDMFYFSFYDRIKLKVSNLTKLIKVNLQHPLNSDFVSENKFEWFLYFDDQPNL